PVQRQFGAGHQRVADAASGKTGEQAGGLVQRFSLSSGELEDGAAGGGQGGVSFRRVVPACGIHRDQPGNGQPGGGAVLQQAGDGGSVDQRRQAGSQDHQAELPSVPVQRGAALAERARVQPGKPVAAFGTAEEDRELVADQFAAAVGEDRRQAGQACPVLLADAGRGPSHTAPVWENGRADQCAESGERVKRGDGSGEIRRPRRWGRRGVLWNALKRQDFPVLDFLGTAQLALGGAKRRLQGKTCTSEDQKLEAGYIITASGSQNGNPGYRSI